MPSRPAFTTRTELLADLAQLSDLGKVHNLQHRPVADETTIAELKCIRCDFDADIVNANNGKETAPTPQEAALAALNAAFEAWYALSLPDPAANNKTVYQRIELGRAFTVLHPNDARAAALLADLERQAASAERGYWMAEAGYIALCDTKEQIS